MRARGALLDAADVQGCGSEVHLIPTQVHQEPVRVIAVQIPASLIQAWTMSKHFRPWNIDQTLLLPPNVRDFVPKDHVRPAPAQPPLTIRAMPGNTFPKAPARPSRPPKGMGSLQPSKS